MRPTIILTFSFILIFSTTKSQPGSLIWGKSIGNSSANDAANSVCIDKDRNVLVTGTFKGSVDFDPGPDTFNLVSTGTNSAYIAKFNPSGNLIWAKSFGGISYIKPVTITTDSLGNIITAGNFINTVDFDPSDSIFNLVSFGNTGGFSQANLESLFIQKLDSSGNFVWAIRIGANSLTSYGTGNANKIIVDDSSNIYLAGSVYQIGALDFDPDTSVINNGAAGLAFLAKYSSSGKLAWVSKFANNSSGASANYVNLTNGYLYLTGGSTTGIGSIYHLFVRKMDLSGLLIWEKLVYGNTNTIGHSVAVDSNNNVITVGDFGGTAVDFDPSVASFPLNSSNGSDFIQKLDANGNFLWAQNFNTNSNSVTVDQDNNIYIVGSFSGTVDLDPKEPSNIVTTIGNAGYIQKLDANGYLIWAGQFANSGNQVVNEILSDNLRNIYIAGNYSGNQDFDPSSLTSVFQSVSGSQDAFVLKVKDPQTYITVSNGNWHIGSTWLGGVVPPVNAGVIIRHIVFVTADAECYSIILEKLAGSIEVGNGFDLKVSH